jgi:hypothetical protein
MTVSKGGSIIGMMEMGKEWPMEESRFQHPKIREANPWILMIYM